MSNPFLDGTFAQAPVQARTEYGIRLAEKQRLVQQTGVRVGDLVTVSWKIDDNFGGGMGSHMGEVERLDTMIYVAPSMRDKGALKMSLASIHHIRVERSEATSEERDAMRDALEDDEDELDHDKYGWDEDPAEQEMQARENPFMQDAGWTHASGNNPFI